MYSGTVKESDLAVMDKPGRVVPEPGRYVVEAVVTQTIVNKIRYWVDMEPGDLGPLELVKEGYEYDSEVLLEINDTQEFADVVIREVPAGAPCARVPTPDWLKIILEEEEKEGK